MNMLDTYIPALLSIEICTKKVLQKKNIYEKSLEKGILTKKYFHQNRSNKILFETILNCTIIDSPVSLTSESQQSSSRFWSKSMFEEIQAIGMEKHRTIVLTIFQNVCNPFNETRPIYGVGERHYGLHTDIDIDKTTLTSHTIKEI